MSTIETKYDAIIVDTSIFERHGLRLEKGLLQKLSQFKRSPIDLLLPDVIEREIYSHLIAKMKVARSSLEKFLNEASDHLFFEEILPKDHKSFLINNDKIKSWAELRIANFIEETGAIAIECEKYVTVSSLLNQYFSIKPPFADTGKKKSEFPDAIALLAIEEWAKIENKRVLAIAIDKDWERFCAGSERIDHIEDLSAGLSAFNKATIPYMLIGELEKALQEDQAEDFLNKIAKYLSSEIEWITPDQDAESYLYWEPTGCSLKFKEFYLQEYEFRIIETGDDYLVLETLVLIYFEADGDFSLSAYDSIDKDYVNIDRVSKNIHSSFETNILITLIGDLTTGSIKDFEIEKVEIVNPISIVDFGTVEPDFE